MTPVGGIPGEGRRFPSLWLSVGDGVLGLADCVALGDGVSGVSLGDGASGVSLGDGVSGDGDGLGFSTVYVTAAAACTPELPMRAWFVTV